jgi:uncharacterized cysteine cluster protein YcgN (CxxCxxCC family)
MGLVPGRECGGCGVCCEVPAIDDKELQKPEGAVCLHFAKGQGCTIYETRPQTCRAHYCSWRYMPNLDDGWRPDKSGVYITGLGEDVPEDHRTRGLKLVIGSAQAIARQTFVEFICAMVENDIPIYLSIPGPMGHPGAKVLANADLAGPVRDKDVPRIVDLLSGLLRNLASFAKDAPPMRKCAN